MKYITLIGGVVFALVGCIGERPVAPKEATVVPPSSWLTDLGPGGLIDRSWWTAFHDPALTLLVETALNHNVDVAIAASRIMQARAAHDFTHAQLLPEINVGIFAERSKTVSPFGLAQYQNDDLPLLTLSYDVDLFGRLQNANAASYSELLANEAARDTIKLAVAASTASGYISLRTLDARLATVHETLESRSQALKIARRRAVAGYTSQLELHQAEAEYKATAQLVPVIELAMLRQEHELSLLLGESPRSITRGLGLIEMTTPGVPSGLPSDLLRRRPDIYSAEQQLVAADHSLDSARAAFMPHIELTPYWGLASSTLLENSIWIWSLGGSILAPIFDGGRIQANADSAAAKRDQAAFFYKKTALTAFREVEDSMAEVSSYATQVDVLQGQRDALALALKIATNRYNAGYAPYLDQIDAQRGLLNAELSLIQVKGDRLIAVISLYRSLGGGWGEQPD